MQEGNYSITGSLVSTIRMAKEHKVVGSLVGVVPHVPF
jgi:hypothetical protein